MSAERMKLLEELVIAAKDHLAGLEEDEKAETDEKLKKRIHASVLLSKESLGRYETELKELKDGEAARAAGQTRRRAFRW